MIYRVFTCYQATFSQCFLNYPDTSTFTHYRAASHDAGAREEQILEVLPYAHA